MSGNPQSIYAQPQTDGKAVGSLVCGILGLMCVLPIIGSIIAVILGHSALGNIKRSQGQLGGEGLAIGGLVTGYLGFMWILVIVPIMAAIMVPAIINARDKTVESRCLSNEKQLVLALVMYADDYQGRFPPDLATLAEPPDPYLPPGPEYTCPSAPPASTPKTAAEIRAGKCGYVYVAGGTDLAKIAAPGSTVILYDKPGNHRGRFICVAFADDHVERVEAASIEAACLQKGWILPAPAK